MNQTCMQKSEKNKKKIKIENYFFPDTSKIILIMAYIKICTPFRTFKIFFLTFFNASSNINNIKYMQVQFYAK